MDETLKNFVLELAASPYNAIEPVFNEKSSYGYYYPRLDYITTDFNEQKRILTDLVNEGVLRVKVWDSVGHCPYCTSLFLSLRSGCPKCKSINIHKLSLIHHYHCGFVGPEADFLKKREFICPKCSKKMRHIGVDYERPSEIYVCMNCNEKFSHATEGFVCMKCRRSFEKNQADNQQVLSYELDLAGVFAMKTGKKYLRSGTDIETYIYSRIYAYEYFLDTFSRELLRSIRHRLNICLIRIDWENYETIAETSSPGELTNYAGSFVDILKSSLREIDIASGYNKNTFLILLPDTNKTAGRTVIDRIMTKISNQYPNKEITISTKIAAFPENGNTIAALFNAIELNLLV